MKILKVLKDWIVMHKPVSVIIAAVIVVGVTSAVVLPIALSHKHDFSAEWVSDGENHWHVCTGKKCEEVQDKAPHIYDGESDADCNVCGATRTLSTRYQAKDETEWNAVFDFKSLTHYSSTSTVGGAFAEIVRDGDIIKTAEYLKGETGNTKDAEAFYIKDGESYSRIVWIEGSEQEYKRESIYKDDYEVILKSLTLLALGDCKYTDFTYDEAANQYSNESATCVITLTFVGGAISKIEAVVKGINPTALDMTITTTITFEETALAVPAFHTFAETWISDAESHWRACTDEGCTVMNDKAAHSFIAKNDTTKHWNECRTCGYKIYTSIDAARYENALNFKDEDGKFYQNIDIVFINGTTKVFQYKVTENAAYYYHYNDTDNDETIWTNENGKGVIYTRRDANSQWVRTEYTEAFNDFASCVLPVHAIKNYTTSLTFGDKLTYNKDDRMYHGSYKQTSNVTVEVSMSFENGKLVRLIYESTNSNSGSKTKGTRTIAYGNAVIEIPKADEVGKTVAVLPYDNGNFALDARLSAGDNWFVIEISDAMIAQYGKEISGKFTASGNSASLTLNVNVYNEADTEITNYAMVGKGELSCEELSAGRYYIKIAASEACTGTFGITIAV